MMKASSVSSFTIYAKIAAAAVVTILAVGLLGNVSGTVEQSLEAPSFLQMKEERQRLRGAKTKCPDALLKEYPDCTVVSFRGNISIGKGGLKPQPSRSSIMVFTGIDEEKLPKGHRSILGWKPDMQETKSTCKGQEDKKVSLVHHVNAYMYKDLKLPSNKVFTETSPELKGLAEDTAVMVASHDKEAGTYVLPSGYGIPANAPISIEFHLLFPTCWDHNAESQTENSGMDLYVTGTPTKYSAALIGALNFNMEVGPHQGAVDYVTRMSAEKIEEVFTSNMVSAKKASSVLAIDQDEESQSPAILAVHLHTHDLTDGKFFEVLNSDGSTAFRSDEEKGGYGLKEQSFLSLAEKGWPELRLKPGQSLQQHCKINSDHLDHTLVYGLEWDQEMCAPLLIVGGPGIDSPPTLLSTMDTHFSFLGRMLADFANDVVHEMGRLTFAP